MHRKQRWSREGRQGRWIWKIPASKVFFPLRHNREGKCVDGSGISGRKEAIFAWTEAKTNTKLTEEWWWVTTIQVTLLEALHQNSLTSMVSFVCFFFLSWFLFILWFVMETAWGKLNYIDWLCIFVLLFPELRLGSPLTVRTNTINIVRSLVFLTKVGLDIDPNAILYMLSVRKAIRSHSTNCPLSCNMHWLLLPFSVHYYVCSFCNTFG